MSSITKKLISFSLLLVTGLAACSPATSVQANPTQAVANNPTQPPADTPVPTQVPTSLPTLSGDPKTIVTNAIQILPTLTYRKNEWFADTLGMALDLGNPPTLVAEFTPPNNSFVVWGSNEYLTLNGSFYSRKSGEAWVADVPGAVSQSAAVTFAAMVTSALQSDTLTIRAAGGETVNGVPTKKFQYDGTVDAGNDTVQVSGKVWIGEDGRMLKLECDMADTGVAFDLSTYEYDVSVQMPAP